VNFLKYLWASILGLGQAGQVPSSVTDSYDAILSTTLRNYSTKLKDNITKGNKVLAWLESKGRTRKVSGGHQIAEPLMHAQNGTADIFSGYGLLDTTPQDGITTAFFDWSQMSVSITISRKEERQNSGKAKILDLLQAKTMQAEVSLKELFNNSIVAGRIIAGSAQERILQRIGRLDSAAVGPLPIGALIDVTTNRSVSVGNINGGTYSFWRNQATASTATTFVGLKNEMNQVYNNCIKGIAGAPDLLLGTQAAWETYWLALQNNERYIINEKKTVDVLGGSDALAFRSSAFIWDEVVPDPDTSYNPVDALGTDTHATVYFINSQAMSFVTDSETDFITTDFVRPENQDAKVAQVMWMGATTISNRRKLGVLSSIVKTIVA
jgi:hypothetical protein